MTSWTFLIQQEGDNVWLPLESSGSEVLEGRYRVMARTTQSSCPLVVQISHLDLDVLPPSRRILKRQARTNSKGLVALLPFTLLKPGVWNIHCQWQSHGPSEDETPKRVRKQTLKFQVLEQESGADLDGVEFYPQDLHNQELPDLAVHHNSINIVEPSSSLAATVDSPLETDRYGLENDADTSTDSEDVKTDDTFPSLTMEERGDAIAGSNSLQRLTSGLRPSSADEWSDDPIVQPTDPTNSSSPFALQEDPLSLGETEQHSSPAPDRSAIADPIEERPPTKDATECDDEMQGLLDTADQMAAHIIETMNAELHRIQQAASPSISVPPSAEAHNISRGDVKTTIPKESVAPSDGTPGYLLLDQPSVQQMWDEDALKRLGLTINLARDCYTVVNDQLILTGMIEASRANDAIGSEQGDSPQTTSTRQESPNFAGLTLGLRVHLIQPQSGTCLLEHDVSLPLSTVPAPFSVLMAIPKDLKTHVLVGEVMLAMATAPAPDSQTIEAHQTPLNGLEADLGGILAQQSFTVTVEIGTLLDTLQLQRQAMAHKPSRVASEIAEAEPLLPTSSTSAPSVSSPPAEPDGSVPSKIENWELQPVGYSPLPPKLVSSTPSREQRQPASGPPERNDSESTSSSTLDLPHFLRTDSDRPLSPMAIAITQAMQSTATQDLSPGEAMAESFHQPEEPPSPVIDSSEDPLQRSTPAQTVASDSPLATDLDLSENPFGALVEDDITLHELTKVDDGQPSSVANDVASDVPQSSGVNDVTNDIQSASVANDAQSFSVTNASQSSVVTIDETKESETEQKLLEERTTVSPPLPEHMPIPTPTLIVPQDDLIAGMPVRISVTLPASVMPSDMTDRSLTQALGTPPPISLIFVKLWVQDRQTRSILDGPRWLVDFIPNQAGELEAMTQLVLPIGCLEVSVEAIAVEMATQRESHKTTLHRSIMPSSMPNSLTIFDFDDLN